MDTTPKVKILHIASSDTGGAFHAAYRIHTALLRKDINSEILALNHYKQNLKKVTYWHYHKFSLFDRLKTRFHLELISRRLYQKVQGINFSVIKSPFKLHNHPLVNEASILHLHWIDRFLDYESFFKRIQKPIVWTLHDMAPITGGCHYSLECSKFTENCNDCPLVQNSQAPKLANNQFSTKARLFQQKPINAGIFPSLWLMEAAKTSKCIEFNTLQHIPYALDLNIFKPIPQETARAIFHLPEKDFVTLFVSQYIYNPYKGFDDLAKELFKLLVELPNLKIIVLGFGDVPEHPQIIKLDPIVDEKLLAVLYAAVDLLLLPSIADNLPNVMLESIACGTPVIAYQTGGITDIVKPHITGQIVTKNKPEKISEWVQYYYKNPDQLKPLRKSCRTFAENNFEESLIAQKYLQVYKEVLSTNALSYKT